MLIISCYSVLVFLKFKPTIKFEYLLFCAGLITILIVSLIVSPKSYSSILTHNPYMYETLVFYEIGAIDLLSGFASCIVDMLFGFLFIFILPCVCNKNNLKIFLLFVFTFVILECFYSIIFEFKKYVITIVGDSAYGGYEIDISASFITKNQFGPFLVIGFIAGFFSVRWYYSSHRVLKPLFYSFLSLIGVVVLFSLCKTAIVSLILFLAPFVVNWFIKNTKDKNFKPIIVVASTFTVFVLFIIVVMFSPLGQVVFFSNIKKVIKSLFVDSFKVAKESRYITWYLSMSALFNYHILIGYPKGSLQYVLRIQTNGYAIYPHNGFIQQTLCYGLFGLFVLFYLYYFLLKRLSRVEDKSNRRLWIALLLSSLVFMTTETEVIIMSSSLLTFGYNILLCSIPLLKKPIINKKEAYYEINI